jgi:exonuclease III
MQFKVNCSVVKALLYLTLLILIPITMTNNLFSGLDFACINVNSLNMSAGNKPQQMRKIYGIVKLKTDVIFMSDVRISNRNLVCSSNDVAYNFCNNSICSYKSFFHSTSNKRGVGILIKNSLDFSVEDRQADEDENYLLLKIRIQGNILILGAIYGPNTLNEQFFVNLEAALISLGDYPILISGDWNTTESYLPVEINPDCFNMAFCPNQRHSVILKEMCDRMRLVDPLRFLYPNERNYSYIPRNALANNRSRIDFFIISHSRINSVEKCYISDHLQSTMFDHIPVFLQLLGKIRQRRSPTICNKILRDPDIELVVDLSVKETYLIYQIRPVENKRALLAGIGTNVGRLREAGLNKSFYRLADPDPAEELRRQQLITLINDFRSSAEFLSIVDYPVNINDDLFFEMLLNNIQNDIIGYQCYVFREKSV